MGRIEDKPRSSLNQKQGNHTRENAPDQQPNTHYGVRKGGATIFSGSRTGSGSAGPGSGSWRGPTTLDQIRCNRLLERRRDRQSIVFVDLKNTVRLA